MRVSGKERNQKREIERERKRERAGERVTIAHLEGIFRYSNTLAENAMWLT